MTQFLFTLRGSLKKLAVSFTSEILALWFAFLDRRVKWYAKLVLASGVIYLVSPWDLIADTVPFWGQVDDLIVLRISYLLGRKIIEPGILTECRQRATAFFSTGTQKRYFILTLVLVWGTILLLFGRYLSRKFGRGLIL